MSMTIESSSSNLTHEDVVQVLEQVETRNPNEPEFLQAVHEVLGSLGPVLDRHPEYVKARILDRIVEPERVIEFRVPWVDDSGDVRVNRGFRIEFNSAIGPYKGGLRFHHSVNRSILKFLGFEQVFKNSLTTLPMGGGKGGSDFSPHGCSNEEIMRFCQSFMNELYRHIGPDTDVPAGDIGVGGREIGYLYGQYRKLTNTFTCVLTGKSTEWGGSLIRPEATGYGSVYFAAEMLQTRDMTLDGKTCLVSGAGNVAQFTIEKLLALGAKPVSISDSSGFIHDPDGITHERLEFLMHLKNHRRGRVHEYAEKFPSASFHATEPGGDSNPLWQIPCDCAFPSATQNEINEIDAKHLVDNGCYLVSEGANMPTTSAGQAIFKHAGILYGPGKAANAGGVAVSGLEMAQASQRMYWSSEEVDRRLKGIMASIHKACIDAADEYGTPGDYVNGSNIAGFTKVADAMMAQGVI